MSSCSKPGCSSCASGGDGSQLAAPAPAPAPAAAVVPQRTMPQFYKRELPDQCVAFTSAEGRRLFREALDSGTMECYFPLAEQFRTQGPWKLVFDAWCAPHLPGCTRRACILRAFNARVHAQRTESRPRPSMEGCLAVVRRKHGPTRRYTRLAACMRAPLTVRSVCLVCAAHRVCAIASLTAVSPWKSSKHKVGAILCLLSAYCIAHTPLWLRYRHHLRSLPLPCALQRCSVR